VGISHVRSEMRKLIRSICRPWTHRGKRSDDGGSAADKAVSVLSRQRESNTTIVTSTGALEGILKTGLSLGMTPVEHSDEVLESRVVTR
jgi:hypothetical protein